jgi:hypothetical protein
MGVDAKQAQTYFIYGLVLIGSLAYIAVSWFGIPVLRYYPVSNEFKVGKTQGQISMGYYGKFFLVIPIAFVGALIILQLSKGTSIFSGTDSEELVFRSFSTASVFVAIIYYIGHEGSEIIVGKGGVNVILHAVIWVIVLLVLLGVIRTCTKLAVKSVHGEKKRDVI